MNLLVWIIRLLFPILIFWIYWRDNSRRGCDDGDIPYPHSYGTCVYDREYILALKYASDSNELPQDFPWLSSRIKTRTIESLGLSKRDRKKKSTKTTSSDHSDKIGQMESIETIKKEELIEKNISLEAEGSSKRDRLPDDTKKISPKVSPKSSKSSSVHSLDDMFEQEKLKENNNDPHLLSSPYISSMMESKSSSSKAVKEKTERYRKEDRISSNIDKMEIENVTSLINYLCYHPGQGRHFLPDKAPPPPPRTSTEDPSPLEMQRCNEEAIRVLKGALHFQNMTAAYRILESFNEKNIQFVEETYVWMVRLAITSEDMKAASSFLMKMEGSGFSPPVDLLEAAMTLYNSQKELLNLKKKDNVEEKKMVSRSFYEPGIVKPRSSQKDISHEQENKRPRVIQPTPRMNPLTSSWELPADVGYNRSSDHTNQYNTYTSHKNDHEWDPMDYNNGSYPINNKNIRTSLEAPYHGMDSHDNKTRVQQQNIINHIENVRGQLDYHHLDKLQHTDHLENNRLRQQQYHQDWINKELYEEKYRIYPKSLEHHFKKAPDSHNSTGQSTPQLSPDAKEFIPNQSDPNDYWTSNYPIDDNQNQDYDSMMIPDYGIQSRLGFKLIEQ